MPVTAGLIFLLMRSKVEFQVISPVLGKARVLGINQWFPQNESGEDGDEEIKISAKAAFFIDSQTGQVLYAKNPYQRLPIASLAKIMTVVVALEHKSLEDQLLVSDRAANMEPDEMILLPGEKLTLKELLYGIFLISANDSAEVLAEESVGKRNLFLELMNSKAKQLGMGNTFFANPTGLDEDSGNSYSTAYDLAILSRYAIHRYPFLVDISKTEHIYLPITENHQDYDMYSGINLLTTYPGVVGFKNGYTLEAGLTNVTLARRKGHEVIGILLGSDNRREETKMLLDYSFTSLGVKIDK